MQRAFGRPLLVVLFASMAVRCFSQAPEPAHSKSVPAEVRRQRLQALFEEEWQYEMRSSPEWATSLGDNRYNDRLGDYSAKAARADTDQRRKFLKRFLSLNPDGLSQQDMLSRQLMIRELGMQIEGSKFKDWEMPVNQRDGPHLELPDLPALTPFNNVQDYENYISRLKQVSRVFDQVMVNMRQGMRDGLMPPRFLLEKVSAEAEEIGDKTAESSPFFSPLKKFPSEVSEADQKPLQEAAVTVISEQIIPAYKRFGIFVRDQYASHGRTQPGVWSLPDGDARYRFQIRRMTTTDLTADEIHQIGLKQLAETEAEMLALAQKLGFKDLATFNQHIKDDRRLYATSGQQLLDLYAGYVRSMETELPKLFGRLPKSALVAIPMEEARSKNGVPADYSSGTPDGSRPGHINVNEWDPDHRLLLNVEAIAYHEGVPGHHLQISLAQEMPGLPAFRQHGGYTAYVEGWAFYSERLGKEVGKYEDPYSEYGRLENEMWRDIRLVVETGVHAKHWSRDEMVEYFHRYTAMDEPNVQSEVDRYIGWPAQALGYKLGQIEILKLREEARQKLGSKFDLRAFHDKILDSGPLPLDVLHSQVEEWIAAQTKP